MSHKPGRPPSWQVDSLFVEGHHGIPCEGPVPRALTLAIIMLTIRCLLFWPREYRFCLTRALDLLRNRVSRCKTPRFFE